MWLFLVILKKVWRVGLFETFRWRFKGEVCSLRDFTGRAGIFGVQSVGDLSILLVVTLVYLLCLSLDVSYSPLLRLSCITRSHFRSSTSSSTTTFSSFLLAIVIVLRFSRLALHRQLPTLLTHCTVPIIKRRVFLTIYRFDGRTKCTRFNFCFILFVQLAQFSFFSYWCTSNVTKGFEWSSKIFLKSVVISVNIFIGVFFHDINKRHCRSSPVSSYVIPGRKLKWLF